MGEEDRDVRVDRRSFLAGTGALLASAAVSGCGGAPIRREGGKAGPNVVLILADDMGWGDLACQAVDDKVPTPNLDRMAREGTRFTDAHSPSSVCTPTRYAILTGRYCWRTRLKRGVLRPWAPPLIEEDRLTLPEMFRKRGYRTACVGKWHLGWDWPWKGGGRPGGRRPADPGRSVDFRRPIGGGPVTRGFDFYFGDDVPNYPPYAFIENDRVTKLPTAWKPKGMFGHPGPMVPGWKLDEVMPALTRRAVAFLEESAREGRPFFLYFALTAPHTPIVPAREFRGKTRGGPYGDYVYQVDWTVGRILETLARLGLDRETLVIFTSDNGSPARNGRGACGPVGSEVRDYGHRPSAWWRGLKGDAWDGGHRVPFLARWPGKVPAGRVCGETICQVDLFASLARLLSFSLPDDAAEDSWDVIPAFLGRKEGKGAVRGPVVHHSFDGMFCVRKGRWKLILGRGSGGFSRPRRIRPRPGEPAGQLYDMSADPRERKNLWSVRPDVVGELQTFLEEARLKGRTRPLHGR